MLVLQPFADRLPVPYSADAAGRRPLLQITRSVTASGALPARRWWHQVAIHR